MWSVVESKLAALLGSRIFPELASDPGYRVPLRNAGLLTIAGVQDGAPVGKAFAAAQDAWRTSQPMLDKVSLPGVKDLTAAQKERLRTAMAMCTRLAVMEVRNLDCLVEQGADARLLKGEGSIYRVWDSKSDNQTRHWWFSEALKFEAIRQGKVRGIAPAEWIRDALAISLDFGKCDRISRMALRGSEGIPAIVAEGLPMPQRMTVHRDAGGVTRGQADADYWARLGKVYLGAKTQYFLPFVPPDLIRADSWG